MIIDLEQKISGKLPVTKKELFELINSHGRLNHFKSLDDLSIEQCSPKECYDLSNLDVSKIDDLAYIFIYSSFNGDISKWDLSNCLSLHSMFFKSEFNNNSLKDWNVSNVLTLKSTFEYSIFNGDISSWDVSSCTNMNYMFYKSKFDGDISNWKLNKNLSCDNLVFQNHNFAKKYSYPSFSYKSTNDFISWFENNRSKIKELNITQEDKDSINDYLLTFELPGVGK